MTRIGRDGFTGSAITDWCDECGDYVVRSGPRCVWCDGVKPTYVPPADWRTRARRDPALDGRIVALSERGYSRRRIALAVGMAESGVAYRLKRIAFEARRDAA